MKVLLGKKLHNLKDCIGYTTRPFLNYTWYYLIYERHEKPSLVFVTSWALDDLRFYNVKYIDFNEYVKEKKHDC